MTIDSILDFFLYMLKLTTKNFIVEFFWYFLIIIGIMILLRKIFNI